MSPTDLVASGPAFWRSGILVHPVAAIHSCEGCGESAIFGQDGKWWCAWSGGKAVCRRAAPLRQDPPPAISEAPSTAEPNLFDM